jgi:hypothetical protein
MRPLAVAAMAAVVGADCLDCWPEGRRPEARRRGITTAPQLPLMSMTATVAKLINGEYEGNGNSDGPIENNANMTTMLTMMTTRTTMGGGRTEAQTWDDCGGVGRDGGRGGEGGGG